MWECTPRCQGDRIIESAGGEVNALRMAGRIPAVVSWREKDYQPVWQWFRYKVRGRLFAAVCSPGPEYKIYGGHDLVNLKCGAAEGELARPGIRTSCRDFIRISGPGFPACWTENCRRRSCGTCAAGHTPRRWRSRPNTSGGAGGAAPAES